jgi:hypothetical protein
LNKQSWTAEKGWSSSLGVGRGANKHLNSLYTENKTSWEWHRDHYTKIRNKINATEFPWRAPSFCVDLGLID